MFKGLPVSAQVHQGRLFYEQGRHSFYHLPWARCDLGRLPRGGDIGTRFCERREDNLFDSGT